LSGMLDMMRLDLRRTRHFESMGRAEIELARASRTGSKLRGVCNEQGVELE
jgi:hypothetical protein